jgi:FtsH-binding integral membrane protein
MYLQPAKCVFAGANVRHQLTTSSVEVCWGDIWIFAGLACSMHLSRAPSRCCLQLPTTIASMTCVVLAWAVQWSESTYTYYDDDDDYYSYHQTPLVNVYSIGSNIFLMVVILFYLAEIIHNTACSCKISNQTVNGYQARYGDQVV